MIAKITINEQTICVPCTKVRPHKHIIRLEGVPETSYPDIDALLSHFSLLGNSVIIRNREYMVINFK